MKFEVLHSRAREAAARFFKAEAELLDILQKIDATKSYRAWGYTSLFSYTVDGLKLSESTDLNMINVPRKTVQVPALKQEIEAGRLSVTKARKIVPVLNLQNQDEWLENAKTLTSRKLEEEVARVAPKEASPARVKFVNADRVHLSLDLEKQVMEMIKRVQDIESQKKQRAVSLEEALEAMSSLYLERNDPVEKAKKAKVRSEKTSVTGQEKEDENRLETSPSKCPQATKNPVQTKSVRGPISAQLKHEVNLRDHGQCTAIDKNGNRCERRRWTELHHVVPVAKGGRNTLQYLVTLCAAHHRMRHENVARC